LNRRSSSLFVIFALKLWFYTHKYLSSLLKVLQEYMDERGKIDAKIILVAESQ